jgi:uncharacterized protein HemY
MKNRIQEIREMIRKDPDDPFLHYAIALEFVKNRQEKDAENSFSMLLKQFPDYLPTYYQAAHFFYHSGKNKKAKEIFKKGIKLADHHDEANALRELRSAYEQFLFEIENDL